ncbi:MAG: hypothetical protein HRU30_09405 [Rhodobacteraceae bacterium]|nr:hypothetical protein [Paracoccaceae bacterium]
MAEAPRFDAYILDGRPHSSQQTLEIGKAADLIVIPTGQTKDDLRPAVKLAHGLADAGISLGKNAFALVKTTNSDAELNAARAYLEQTDCKTLGGLCLYQQPMALRTTPGRSSQRRRTARSTRKLSGLQSRSLIV